jgi:N-acetylneuraminic acid mutarotase
MKTRKRNEKPNVTFIMVLLVTAVLTSVGRVAAATWTQKADMSTARWGLSTSMVDGKIYAFGGQGGLRKVEEYDPATDTWTDKADMPTGRASLASSAVDGKIYVIGGYTSFGGSKLATVEEYDPATDTWTQKADMPGPRGGLGTSVVNGRIYAVGGNGSGGYVAAVWEYDPATDTWTTKADMPTRRNLAPTSVVNGKIYAFGGQTPNNGPAVSTVEEYDPATDTWTKKADMPTVRNWLSTSVVDEKIYAFGGNASKGGPPLSTLFQYDPATDTWTAEDDMPVSMAGMSTSVVGGRIYVIGGTSAGYPYSTSLSTVWEFIPALEFDFNGDGIVDAQDMSIMIDHWHTDTPRYDLAPQPAGDGIVDVQDLIALSEHLFEDYRIVAHWMLDETEGMFAYDSAGENDGIVLGNPVWQPEGGQVNGALEFDGIDDVIIIETVLDPADSPFSVFAWIKGGVPGQVILSQESGVNWLMTDIEQGAFGTDISDPIQSSRQGSIGGLSLISPTIITDDNWHRVGFTWDGSTRLLYVDDLVVAEDTLSNLADASKGLRIGISSSLEAGSFWSGMIDDVRIYDRAVKP